jgi:hypothetical protein
MNRMTIILVALSAATITCEAKWALVVQNEVRQTWSAKPDFHPDAMRNIYSVSNEVDVGWRKAADGYLPPKTIEEKERDSFDAKRDRLKAMSVLKARKQMSEEFLYKLTGDDLNTGYPDKTQPLCVTDEGETVSLSDFMDYIQMKDDDGATQQELQVLKQKARAARRYFKTIKPQRSPI